MQFLLRRAWLYLFMGNFTFIRLINGLLEPNLLFTVIFLILYLLYASWNHFLAYYERNLHLGSPRWCYISKRFYAWCRGVDKNWCHRTNILSLISNFLSVFDSIGLGHVIEYIVPNMVRRSLLRSSYDPFYFANLYIQRLW